MYMGAGVPGPRVSSSTRRMSVGRGSSGSGLSSPGTTGVSSQLIGPFPASQGCPAGSVVAHTFGQGLKKKVQCRVIQKAASSAPAPQMAPPTYEAPIITVSPTFQQDFNAQVSPVISPAIASPGATTSGTPVQVSPGGQQAAGGGNASPQSSGLSWHEQQRLMNESIQREREMAQQQIAAKEAQIQQQREFEERQRSAEQAARQREEQLRGQLDIQRREMEERMRQAETEQQHQEYQRLLDEQTEKFNEEIARAGSQAQSSQAPQFIPGPAVIPGPSTPTPSTPVEVNEGVPFWVWLAGGAVVILGGIYYVNKPKKRARK